MYLYEEELKYPYELVNNTKSTNGASFAEGSKITQGRIRVMHL